MPRSSGNTGRKWFKCARSGWYFPMEERVLDSGHWVAARFSDGEGRLQESRDPRSVIQLPSNPLEDEDAR